jgi:hypothetical protein
MGAHQSITNIRIKNRNGKLFQIFLEPKRYNYGVRRPSQQLHNRNYRCDLTNPEDEHPLDDVRFRLRDFNTNCANLLFHFNPKFMEVLFRCENILLFLKLGLRFRLKIFNHNLGSRSPSLFLNISYAFRTKVDIYVTNKHTHPKSCRCRRADRNPALPKKTWPAKQMLRGPWEIVYESLLDLGYSASTITCTAYCMDVAPDEA